MFARSSTFCALCLLTLFLDISIAEWVDMPQFSDETKIYRIPAVQYDQFYKVRRADAHNTRFPKDQGNDSQIHSDHPRKTEVKRVHSVSTSTTPSNLFRYQIADSFAEIDKNRSATNTDNATENKLMNRYETISPTKDTTLNTLTTQSPSTTTRKQETPRDEYYNDTLKRDDGIFQYLPVDVFKSVHETLRSQPMSFEGKLHFLKMFEKTLMAEIESRLAATMAPSRKIRGADHYHGHGYDDHDDHSIGFPSIEGALMAISFLTFAVYLVRLVMLLFRNINPPTTTTAATVFLGRRKRSADLDDDAVRILSNMNTFVPDF